MKPNWRDNRSVEGNLKARLPAMALAFFSAGRKAMKPNRTWNQMHKFRLAAKEFRYTLELFRPVLGAELEARLEAVQEIQQFLGDINDAVNVRKLLKPMDGADPLREKLAKKLESKRKALILHWNGQFDAPGELEKWQAYLTAEAGIATQAVQQKVQART